MPNSLLDEYRQQFPKDDRSDDTLTLYLGQTLPPETFTNYPDFASDYHRISLAINKANAGPILSELTGGIKSGIDTAQAKLYDTAALAGDIFGVAPLQRFGEEGYQRNLAEAAQNSPTIENVRDIGSLSDAARYTLGLVGSQAPQLGLTVAGGAAGALLGGPAGAALGVDLGTTIPAAVGAGLAGFTQMQNYGELKSTPGIDQSAVVPTALAVGTVGAALEELLPASWWRKLMPGASVEVAKNYLNRAATAAMGDTLARVGTAAAKDALLEGGTEMAQELATIAGEAYANRHNPDYQLTSEDIQNRLINNGFAGVLLGGGIGAGVEAVSPHAHVNETPPNVEQPPPPAAPPVAGLPPAAPEPPVEPPPAPAVPLTVTTPEVALDEARRAALAAGIPAPDQPELSPEQAIIAGSRGPAPYIPPGEPPITVPRPVPSPVMPPVNPTPPAPYTPPGEPPITIQRPQQQTIGEPDAQIGQIQSSESVQLPQTQSGGLPTEAASSNRPVEGGPVQTALPLKETVVKPLDVAAVDFNEAAYKGRRTTDEKQTYERPYIPLSPGPYTDELATQLVDRAGTGNPKDKNSLTHRVTFFENTETGQVIGLPTWPTGKGVYVGPREEGQKGTTLKRFMSDGTWQPVASFLLKDSVEGTQTNFSYPDRSTFQALIETPAFEEQRSVLGALGKYQPSLGTPVGFAEDGSVVDVKQTTDTFDADAAAAFVDGLAAGLPVSKGNVAPTVTVDQVEKAIHAAAENSGEAEMVRGHLMDQLLDIKGNLPLEEHRALSKLSPKEQSTVLYNKLAQDLHAKIKVTPELDALARILGGVQEEARRTGYAPRNNTGAGPGAEQYFRPAYTTTAGRVTNGEIARRFAQVAQRLGELGVTFDIFKDLREWGKYRNKDRLITLAMNDVERPSVDNLRTLLHEAAHDLYRNLSPKLQQILHQAIDAMSDDQLGIDRFMDVGFREGTIKPGNVTNELLAQFLAQRGLDAAPAQTVAASLVRFVKELYFRAAMALQRAFGRQPSPDLAMRWVANRFDTMLGGGPLSSFIGAPSPNQRAAEDEELYSMRREGMGERHAPMVIPETKIAAINELLAAQKNIILPVLKKLGLKDIGDTDEEKLAWFRNTFGLENSQAVKDSIIQQAIDPETGNVLPVNQNKLIKDFSAEQNQALAAQDYYIRAQQMYSKVLAETEKLRKTSEDLEAQRKKAADRLSQKISDYTNVEGLTRLVTKEIQGQVRRLFDDIEEGSIKFGVISQELAQLDDTADVIKVYEPVLRKLFGKGRMEHQGEKITAFLERMATDPLIDPDNPDKGIREIREDLKKVYASTGDAAYAPMIQDTQESRALLAAAIAYTKTHEPLMLALALRKVSDVKMRQKINADLEALRGEGEDFVRQMPTIARMSRLETRLFDAMRQEKQKVQAISRKANDAKQQFLAGENTVEALRANTRQAGGENGVHAPSTFGDGMEYWTLNVKDPAKVKALGEGLELNTVKLDSTTGKVTDRTEIIKAIENMQDLIDYRDANGNKDSVYWSVKAQQRELEKGLVTEGFKPADHLLTELRLYDAANQLKATGLASARVAGQQINRYGDVVRSIDHEATAKATTIARAVKKAAQALGVNQEFLLTNFYQPAADILNKSRDVVETVKGEQAQFNLAFDYIKSYLNRDTEKAALLKGKWDKFIPHFKEMMHSAWEMSKWLNDRVREEDVSVIDPRMLVETERGKFVPGERKAIKTGLVTIPQHLSAIFGRTFEIMRSNMGWTAFNPQGIAETWNTMGEPEVRNYVAPFFNNPDVQRNFFQALANKDTESPFNAPVLPDGVTRKEAHPALVAEAFRVSKGDPVEFLKNLYALEGGKTDLGQFMQEGFQTFKEMFDAMRTADNRFDPNGKDLPKDFKTMIPTFMVNARQAKLFPSEWLEYETFRPRQMRRIIQKVAAETAFGPNQRRLTAAFEAMNNEARAAMEKLRDATARVRQTVPGTGKEQEAALEKELGGKEKLDELRKLIETAKAIPRTKEGLISFMQNQHNEIKSVRVIRDIINAMAAGMVEQPTSALSQMAEVFSPLINTGGPSPANIRHVLRNLKEVALLGGEGFINALGVTLRRDDRMYQRYLEMGFGDPEAARSLKDRIFGLEEPDALDPQGVGARFARGIRRVGSVLGAPINQPGTPQPAVAIRPLAPFRTINNLLHAAGTINMWRLANEFVSKGVDAISRLRPDMSLEEVADKIGISKVEKPNFVRFWTTALDDHGLDFYTLAKEADRNQRAGKDALSDRTLQKLMAMGIKSFVTESNIMTMPLETFNNSAINAMLPLLGWSVRRSRQVAGLRLDANGKASLDAAARGLAGLMLLGAGGLGVSALVDLYNEELLKKRRNLRRLTTEAGARNLAQAILEHSARVGTFGLFGDLANSATNVLTGAGDNRGLSFDGRVVAASALTSLVRTVSAFINEGFSTDYATVLRPAMMAAGGNGALQYMQIINQLSGDMFKSEAEAVKRTNINNWLRIIGRETGMEVRPMDGGMGTPTPITPWVTRMQLAAYGNDPADFNRAYQGALREAREEKKPDPVDYVQRSFSARHPLRSIFLSPPSDLDYRRMLMALPEGGREDVRNAVNSFNRFAAMIGGRPYEGRTQSQSQGGTSAGLFGIRDLSAIRDRALFR